jgi:type II secretory pathway component GspD/PulD (secretin)
MLSQQIEQVLLDEGVAAPGGAQPGRAPQPAPQRAPTRGRPAVPGQSQSQVIGSSEEVLRMVTDERLNSLIVVATSGMMEKVRDLVERLDTPTPYEANTLHIYELLNAEAEQVEEALQGLVGGGGSRGSSRARRNNQQQRRNTQGHAEPAADPRPRNSDGWHRRAAARPTCSPSSSPCRSRATTRPIRCSSCAHRRTGSCLSPSSRSSMCASARSTWTRS